MNETDTQQTPDKNETLDKHETQTIHRRAKQGIKLLLGRQVAVQLLTFAGGVVLARTLSPAQVGLYIITLFLVSTFALLGDFGLAASFIQRREELSERDLQVAFTLQQILITVIVFTLLVCAPWLVHFYPKAPPETVWLVRALAFNLYLSAWRTISALQLERHLKYNRLAKIEVVETLTFQGLAVGLAVAGAGVWSYVAATLASGILGTLLVYGASPWPIRFGFDKIVARDILRFGLPFQLQSVINSVGGWVTPAVVGSMIGPAGVGYLNWASANGRKPLIITDLVMRVAFPHFSRIQNDRPEVERVLIRYLTYLLLTAGVWFSVLASAGHSLVEWIYTPKWLPAVPALVIFSAALALDMSGMVVAMTLNAIGQVGFVTRIVLVRSLLNIALTFPLFGLTLPLVGVLGFNAVPVAYLVAATLTVPFMLNGIRKQAFVHIFSQLAWIMLPVLASIIVGRLVFRLGLALFWHMLATAGMTLVLYVLVAWLCAPFWLKRSALSALQERGLLKMPFKPVETLP